jgi:hypothetical protein
MDLMQGCDATLKGLITGDAEGTLRLLGVLGPVSRWLNVELPRVQNQRVDLLAELAAGQLLHIELQSTNDAGMHLRMLEYAVAIWRLTRVFPRQVVLYVGNDRLRTPNTFRSPGIDYRYDLVDTRKLEGDALLDSDSTSDNILALLTGIKDKAAAIRRVMAKIARLDPGKRRDAAARLLVVCGMRGLEGLYKREKENMPTDFDLMDNKILGPAIRRKVEQGVEQGVKDVVRLQIQKRFGPIPQWVDRRITEISEPEARDLAVKLLDASSLEELFR